MPSHMRKPSPIKVQVRGSLPLLLLLLSTPGVHQGCDSPPHTGWQWPTPLSSTWPDSGATPVRRASTRGIPRDRPRCVVRSLPFPVSSCGKGRKKILPQRALRNNHTPDVAVFSSSDQPNIFRITLPGPGDSRELSGHRDSTPRYDFHLLRNPQALVL